MTAKGVIRPAWVKALDDGTWRLYVRVQPGARRNEIAGQTESCLRVRVTAQAVDNKANQALTEFLAGLLGLRTNRLRIVSGETARQKTLLVAATSEPDWGAVCPPDVP